MRGVLRVQQGVGVRTHGIGPPRHGAVGEVVRGHAAAHAELSAADADDDLVLDHHGRARARLAHRGVAVDRLPDHGPRRRVECHHRGVGLVKDDLAVSVRHAAVDRVAAHHRDRARVLLRLVLPDDPAVGVQVESVDDVGKRRVHVHRVADDQRAAFVAAEHAGREGPRDLNVSDVAAVDLRQLAVARVGVVAGGHHPFGGVFLHNQKFVVGARRRR